MGVKYVDVVSLALTTCEHRTRWCDQNRRELCGRDLLQHTCRARPWLPDQVRGACAMHASVWLYRVVSYCVAGYREALTAPALSKLLARGCVSVVYRRAHHAANKALSMCGRVDHVRPCRCHKPRAKRCMSLPVRACASCADDVARHGKGMESCQQQRLRTIWSTGATCTALITDQQSVSHFSCRVPN